MGAKAVSQSEKIKGKAECGSHLARGERRHEDVMPDAEGSHGADTVVGGNVGKDDHVAFLHASLGDEILGKAGGHFKHPVAAEGAPAIGVGDQIL